MDGDGWGWHNSKVLNKENKKVVEVKDRNKYKNGDRDGWE